MTPAARVAAAIDVLDRFNSGEPVEVALTRWARNARYAGSKDRAAVRDLTYGVVRTLASSTATGGGTTGRAQVLGHLAQIDADIVTLFSGQGYGPPALTPDESATLSNPPILGEASALDLPEWLLPELRAALGEDLSAVANLLKTRAPLFLRVNLARTTRGEAIAALMEQGFSARAHDLSPTAIELTGARRGVQASQLYLSGAVELQDAASQAVVDALLPVKDLRVLDFCAGGGGKSLALAALGAHVVASDVDPQRMKDIAPRAQRAGARIEVRAPADLDHNERFDIILCDVPCSGSGAWRRQPESKWRLTPERLDELTNTQAQILENAKAFVAPGGTLALATCSLLARENEENVTHILRSNPGWQVQSQRRISPLEGGDGFYVARLTRATIRQ